MIVTTIVNAVITGAGVWMYFLTDLQMMFLDGFFSAFRELTGDIAKEKAVCDAVANATGLAEDSFTVYKIGMKIKVCIPVKKIPAENRSGMFFIYAACEAEAATTLNSAVATSPFGKVFVSL